MYGELCVVFVIGKIVVMFDDIFFYLVGYVYYFSVGLYDIVGVFVFGSIDEFFIVLIF